MAEHSNNFKKILSYFTTPLFCAIKFYSLGWGFYFIYGDLTGFSQEEKVLLTSLIALPCGFGGITLYTLCRKSEDLEKLTDIVWKTLIFITIFTLLGFKYSELHNTKVIGKVLGWFYLIISIALTYPMLKIAYSTILEQGFSKQDKTLARQTSQAKFVTLSLYCSIFLTITYFLAFSLAIYDRSDNEYGNVLYMVNRKPKVSLDQSDKIEFDTAVFFNTDAHFFYKDDVKENTCADLSDTLNDGKFINGNFIREVTTDVGKKGALNFCHMKQVLEKIKTIADKSSEVIIFLTGKTTKEKPNSDSNYISNYEIAKARVDAIYRWLSNKLVDMSDAQNSSETPLHYKIIITTDIEGSPNNCEIDIQTDQGGSRELELSSDCRQVNIAIKSSETSYIYSDIPAELSILDYIYFSAYTITTSAYGDIYPVSAFSKVVSIIANFIEVLFLIITLNILIAAREISGTKEILNGNSSDGNQVDDVENPPITYSSAWLGKLISRFKVDDHP